jgi:hypothetical protein
MRLVDKDAIRAGDSRLRLHEVEGRNSKFKGAFSPRDQGLVTHVAVIFIMYLSRLIICLLYALSDGRKGMN